MRTGKGRSEGQAFHRRLLSEYNTDITLENYVSYFELKPIVKSIEQLREKIQQYDKEKSDDKLLPISAEKNISTLSFVHRDESTLEDLVQERRVLEERFFKELHSSFVKVKHYLSTLENDLLSGVCELKHLSEEEIRARPEEHIPKLYIKVETILRYRSLNLAALRKIMKKFMERCACDDLQLQKDLMSVDSVIYNSSLSQPRLDLRHVALDLIALYGTVYKLTYEEAVTRLGHYEAQSSVNARRIFPHSDTFFFTLNFPHQKKQGNFAVRILAGNTSIFCEKMICEVLQCPRYPPCCGTFPNGEINVTLSRPLRGDDVYILQSLVQCEHLGLSHSSTLMELALMIHTARLSSAARVTAVIPYLGYSGSVSSIALVAELLEAMGCQHVITVDMSIEQVEGMFSIPLENISARYEFVRYIANQLTLEGHDFSNITFVASTGTAVNRAKCFADALMNYKKLSSESQFVSLCTAVHRHSYQPPPQQQQQKMLSSEAHSLHSPDVVGKHPRPQYFTSKATQPTCDAAATRPAAGAGTNMHANPSHAGDKRAKEDDSSPRSETLPDVGGTSCRDDGKPSALGISESSTLAFERALRRQEEGITAIRENVEDNHAPYADGVALVGDVKNRLCIIVDTIIDEAIKTSATAWKLHEEGASRIILIATHFIFSAGAEERLVNSPIDLIVVTDSVNRDDVFMSPQMAKKLRLLPIAPLLARAVEKMNTENTLSTLFEK